MKEYELYLPLQHRDGRPLAAESLQRFKQTLADEFGGVTHFPQENEGLWKFGGITFQDRVVILRVLTEDIDRARKFFAQWRTALEQQLGQSEVLIVERDVRIVPPREAT